MGKYGPEENPKLTHSLWKRTNFRDFLKVVSVHSCTDIKIQLILESSAK